MPDTHFTCYFQMDVRWNSDLFILPAPRTYRCSLNPTSPAPSPVRNFRVTGHQILGSNRIMAEFSWSPPATANGELGNYSICVSPEPLQYNEEPHIFGGQTRCVQAKVRAQIVTTLGYTEVFDIHSICIKYCSGVNLGET